MSLSLPALLDDLVVHEILLRFPADEPECLARASLVCKAWRRVLDDPGFRRRFNEFHRAPPMLGLLYKDFYPTLDFSFAPTTNFSPLHPLRPRSLAVDSRHGRVVFEPLWDETGSFNVWDPVTNVHWRVPYPNIPTPTRSFTWNAAVLCAVHGCDHVDCHGGPFLVAFIGTDGDGLTSACVYTSEAGAWSCITSFQHPDAWIARRPSVLLGNTVYFSCGMDTGIMEYDVTEQKLSWIDVPMEYLKNERGFIIMTADGVLGFAGVQDSCLYMWSRLIDAKGAAAWAQPRVIKLDKLLQTPGELYVVGFVEGAGVIFLFLTTCSELLMVDLNSDQVRTISIQSWACIDVAMPYMRFYTPRTSLERAQELFQKGSKAMEEGDFEKKLKDLEQEMSTPSPATDEIMKMIASKASGEQNVGNAMPRDASLTCSQIAGSSTGCDSTTMSTAATTEITRSLQELALESHPMRILEFSERVLRRKVIKFVKVLWSNQTEREATWELENMMRQKYPELFQTENGTAEAQESKLRLPQA